MQCFSDFDEWYQIHQNPRNIASAITSEAKNSKNTKYFCIIPS